MPTNVNLELRYEDGRPIEIPKAKDRNFWNGAYFRDRAKAKAAKKAVNHARNIAARKKNKAAKRAAKEKVS